MKEFPTCLQFIQQVSKQQKKTYFYAFFIMKNKQILIKKFKK